MSGPDTIGGSWPGRRGRVLFVQHQQDCPPGHVGDRIAQHGARVEVLRADRSQDFPDPTDYDLVVPLGSYDSAHDDSVPYVKPEAEFLESAIEADVGVFGICFGAQLLSRVLGGDVFPSPSGPEVGWLSVDTAPSQEADPDGPTGALVGPGPWLVWHTDVMSTPPKAVELARTAVCTQAFAYDVHVGVQFHPEAVYSSVQSWSRTFEPTFHELGLDATGLLEQTQRLTEPARHRAFTLTDRVLRRAAARRRPPRLTGE
jgi:GMP synthase (glutamine-hydrolysing)